MNKWKVSYQDIRALKTHRPFFNLEEVVEANSKVEAINEVKATWDCFGHYGNYKAKKLNEKSRETSR